MGARYWRDRGLAGASSILLNLAGRLELALLSAHVEGSQSAPSARSRLLSAASCFALAGNWPQASTLLDELGPGAAAPDLVETWALSQQVALANRPAMRALAAAFGREHLAEAADLAVQLMGRASPRLLLWPIARAAMDSGQLDSAARSLRLLTIAEPFELAYHVSAAQYDPPDLKARHAAHVGLAFPDNAYAQAFAGFQLTKLGSPERGLEFARAGWSLASRAPNRLSTAQYAFAAMTVSAVFREHGRLKEAVQVLKQACSHSRDPDLATYLAMLLVVQGHSNDAQEHLDGALRGEARTPWAGLLLGTLKLEQGAAADAIPVLREAFSLAGGESTALHTSLNNLGVALAASGFTAEAMEAFNQVDSDGVVAEMAASNAATVNSGHGGRLLIISSEQLAAVSQDEITSALMAAAMPVGVAA